MNQSKKTNFIGRTDLIILLLFIMMSPILSADEVGRAGYAGSFLRMGIGARQMGMGGGSVALADDGYTHTTNPAGLAFIEKRSATGSLHHMALDRTLSYLGYAQPMGNDSKESRAKGLMKAGFAAGWLYGGVQNIDARDFSGNDIGTLSAGQHCFYFSFAISPAENIAIGMSAKLLHYRLPNLLPDDGALSATGFGFDIGIYYRLNAKLSFGASLRDIRSGYTWDTQELYERGTQQTDAFPSIGRIGALWMPGSKNCIVTLDLEKVDRMPIDYIAGVQFAPVPQAFLRAGLRRKGPTFGAGFKLPLLGKQLQIDYALVPDSIAPRANHVFGWSFIF